MLVEAIQSVLNQTFIDFEVIIVDDASSDGTGDILKNFNRTTLSYFQHRVNRGQGAALNTGIRLSKGSFIAILGDDEYLPKKLELQIKKMEDNHKNGLVYTGVLFMDEAGKNIGQRTPSKTCWHGLPHNDFIGATALVRKKCFDARRRIK